CSDERSRRPGEMRMIKPTDAVRLHQRRSRREALRLLGAGAGMLAAAPHASFAQSSEETVLTEALVLRDPDIPVAGNANGDITIVEYFDYQCPYCRNVEPELGQVLPDDCEI